MRLSAAAAAAHSPLVAGAWFALLLLAGKAADAVLPLRSSEGGAAKRKVSRGTMHHSTCYSTAELLLLIAPNTLAGINRPKK